MRILNNIIIIIIIKYCVDGAKRSAAQDRSAEVENARADLRHRTHTTIRCIVSDKHTRDSTCPTAVHTLP